VPEFAKSLRLDQFTPTTAGNARHEAGALSLEIDLNHLPQRKRFLA
jgi:hypothetical protein